MSYHSGVNAELDRYSAIANSSAEINKLSSELNSKISREMDEMINSVSVQIQKAINAAISNQVLPQIQNAIMTGPGHVTEKGWNLPAERPETNPEVPQSEKARNDLRSQQTQLHQHNDKLANYKAYDMVTGEKESPIQVPEFFTVRKPSRSYLNQSHDDLNPLLDTTILAQERIAPAVESDPISRLADVLTNIRPLV